jgi:hypothetical protein
MHGQPHSRGFFFSIASISSLNSLLFQRVEWDQRDISLEVNLSVPETDELQLKSRLRIYRTLPPIPIRLHGVVLN